jgi:hypothetical protein
MVHGNPPGKCIKLLHFACEALYRVIALVNQSDGFRETASNSLMRSAKFPNLAKCLLINEASFE